MVLDHCGQQRLVVNVVGRTNAHLAFKLRVGKVFVASDLARIEVFTVIENNPCALTKAEPQAVRVAHGFGQALVENVRLDALEDAFIFSAPEAASIDGEHDVCRAGHTFALNALDQLIGVAFKDVDFDACLFGERIVEALVRVVVACGVKVELVCHDLTGKRSAHHHRCHRSNKAYGFHQAHPYLLNDNKLHY